jgi:hemerythrin superfamily protein
LRNAVEVIMYEHQSIRKLAEVLDHGDKFDEFVLFNKYLKECHMEVEEEVLFPILAQGNFSDSLTFRARIDRVVADHRLIETLASNLQRWYGSGDVVLVWQRMPLYFKLLVEHNATEDSTLFPRWDEISGSITADSVKEAKNIILSFGKKDYLEATGMSRGEFEKTFG